MKLGAQVSPGDFVIARRGLKTLTAVGKVTQSAAYSPGKIPYIDHPNILGVSWQERPRDKDFSTLVFKRWTVDEISEDEFRKFADTVDVVPPDVEDPRAFILERYLEDFIVTNFDAIFRGGLQIYEDAEGNGQQYDTEIGRIDILAVEPGSNSFVVIELKKGRPSDQVVGQLLRYMGWVKENLCSEGQAVKGLIICRDSDPRLSYALAVTRDIRVCYYNVSFKLTEAPNS